MRQVKGFSKEYYKQECIDEGGTPIEYEDMAAAMMAFRDVRIACGHSPEVSENDLLDDTNGDWIVMDDGTVLHLYYENAFKELVNELTNRARQKRYDAAHRRRITIDFFDPAERDILDKLATVSNKAGYIKRLIRNDIEREQTNNKSVL